MKNLSIVLLIALLSSCASNNSVVQNRLLQKRKYKKGYNLSFKKKVKKESNEEQNHILVKRLVEDEKKKEVAELVIGNETKVSTKNLNNQVEEPFVSSLEVLDYKIKSAFDKAVLLSDSLKEAPLDVDEKVYVKKWDIGTLFGVGTGMMLYGFLYSIYSTSLVYQMLFLLGLVAIVYGIILFDRRFLAQKRKARKAEALEYQKQVEEVERLKKGELNSTEAKNGVTNNNEKLTVKEAKRIEIRSKKWYLARVLSYVFTTLTLVVPIFVFPAAVYTIMVLNIERGNEKKWVRISAIFRLSFLFLFTLLGIIIFANILDSLGLVSLT